MENDEKFNIDRKTHGILQFPNGTSVITCATQITPYQRAKIFGTEGFIEIEIPFTVPPGRATKIWIDNGTTKEEMEMEICNQYTIQGDLFSKSIIEDKAVPTLLEDALENMQVIDAIALSAKSRKWIDVVNIS